MCLLYAVEQGGWVLHAAERGGSAVTYKQGGGVITAEKEAHAIEEQPSGHNHSVGEGRKRWWTISAYTSTSAPGQEEGFALSSRGWGMVHYFPICLGHRSL